MGIPILNDRAKNVITTSYSHQRPSLTLFYSAVTFASKCLTPHSCSPLGRIWCTTYATSNVSKRPLCAGVYCRWLCPQLYYWPSPRVPHCCRTANMECPRTECIDCPRTAYIEQPHRAGIEQPLHCCRRCTRFSSTLCERPSSSVQGLRRRSDSVPHSYSQSPHDLSLPNVTCTLADT